MEEALKFAWAYLIKYGKLTNGTWCHYRGWEPVYNGYVTWEDHVKQQDEFIKKVVEVGVDWEKTGVPTVEEESQFTDTFSPSMDCLATVGTLVLKNGETFIIGSKDDDAAHLASTARELMRGKSEIQELADRL